MSALIAMPIEWPHLDGEAPDEVLVEAVMTGSEWALDLLLHRYRALVRSRARRMFLPGSEPEDLVQEGMIGLYRAIVSFDPTKGESLAALAEVCVRNAMNSAIARATRKKAALLTRALRPDADVPAEATLHDASRDAGRGPEDLVIGRQTHDQLLSFLSTALTSFETEVLRRYLDGWSYTVIAKELERPVKSIDNALQRVRRKVQEFLTGLE